MPGSVSNASPSTVLPRSLYSAFTHQRTYPVLQNEYKNGESQRNAQATNSRKYWKLSKRLTPDLLTALRDFYVARKGKLEPFYFYDPFETTPRFGYDPTGVTTAGRYTVRFNCDWIDTVGPCRAVVDVELVEVA